MANLPGVSFTVVGVDDEGCGRRQGRKGLARCQTTAVALLLEDEILLRMAVAGKVQCDRFFESEG